MKIHQLLNEESKWCQNYFARDEQGQITGLDDAYSYDIIGALITCYRGTKHIDRVYYLLKKRVGELYPHYLNRRGIIDIVKFNDYSTYEEIYNLVKELDV